MTVADYHLRTIPSEIFSYQQDCVPSMTASIQSHGCEHLRGKDIRRLLLIY